MWNFDNPHKQSRSPEKHKSTTKSLKNLKDNIESINNQNNAEQIKMYLWINVTKSINWISFNLPPESNGKIKINGKDTLLDKEIFISSTDKIVDISVTSSWYRILTIIGKNNKKEILEFYKQTNDPAFFFDEWNENTDHSTNSILVITNYLWIDAKKDYDTKTIKLILPENAKNIIRDGKAMKWREIIIKFSEVINIFNAKDWNRRITITDYKYNNSYIDFQMPFLNSKMK